VAHQDIILGVGFAEYSAFANQDLRARHARVIQPLNRLAFNDDSCGEISVLQEECQLALACWDPDFYICPSCGDICRFTSAESVVCYRLADQSSFVAH
jgi:hypothetical protein